MTLLDLRRELEAVFSRKFPSITMYDFDFVKRDRNIVSTPVVKEGHQWDFGHVKHLCGNGRLYVRLVTDREEIELKDATLKTATRDSASKFLSTDTHSLPSTSQLPDSALASGSTFVLPVSSEDGEQDLPEMGITQSISTIEQRVASVAAIFPAVPLPVIRRALYDHVTSERAVQLLLTYRSPEEERVPEDNSTMLKVGTERVKEENCTEVFQRLRGKMHPRGMREKLKVDPEDQFMDVYSYYKSSDCDVLAPISIFVKGQPAIDTGGVLRQVFSEVFLSLANNKCMKHIFTGEQFRKVPVFSNELVVNGFFEVLGKMISHSLVQGGPGFPYLSPAIYWYLATGDLQVALGKASCADVCNKELLKYIDQVHLHNEVHLHVMNIF